MTATTPEQMRALADDLNDVTVDADFDVETVTSAATALRAAADHLEADTALVADVGGQRDYWADRLAAVERVADMAEDDDDGNGWVPVDPLLDALYPDRRRNVG